MKRKSTIEVDAQLMQVIFLGIPITLFKVWLLGWVPLAWLFNLPYWF